MVKHLRNVAHNIAHKFSVSASNFGHTSLKNQISDISISLITGDINPSFFNNRRNNLLVSYCKDNFYNILTENEKNNLLNATLKAHFYKTQKIIQGEFVIIIELKDKREIVGKKVLNHFIIYG
ncbi:MAG: hypothetical protein IE909_10790 [Campylobacterales bacterium]|nr:hypothetical protein [Campylobacterales bacterium]